jgi:hypothetical protein
MTRRLLNLLTALSLPLCAAVGVLWVRSWRARDRGFYCGAVAGDAQRTVDVSSAMGRISVSIERADGFSLGSPPREGARLYAEDLPPA